MNHNFLFFLNYTCIKIKTMFMKTNEIKISKINMNEHKAIIISYRVYQTNKKLFVAVNPNVIFRLESADNLCLPFIDRPQSDVVAFTIIFVRYIKYCNRTEACNMY